MRIAGVVSIGVSCVEQVYGGAGGDTLDTVSATERGCEHRRAATGDDALHGCLQGHGPARRLCRPRQQPHRHRGPGQPERRAGQPGRQRPGDRHRQLVRRADGAQPLHLGPGARPGVQRPDHLERGGREHPDRRPRRRQLRGQQGPGRRAQRHGDLLRRRRPQPDQAGRHDQYVQCPDDPGRRRPARPDRQLDRRLGSGQPLRGVGRQRGRGHRVRRRHDLEHQGREHPDRRRRRRRLPARQGQRPAVLLRLGRRQPRRDRRRHQRVEPAGQPGRQRPEDDRGQLDRRDDGGQPLPVRRRHPRRDVQQRHGVERLGREHPDRRPRQRRLHRDQGLRPAHPVRRDHRRHRARSGSARASARARSGSSGSATTWWCGSTTPTTG